MKSCPTCNKTFTDPNLSFCIDDGTPLTPVLPATDETTVVSPSARQTTDNPPPTEVYQPRDWQAPDYQPPGFQVSGGAQGKKKVWPWVVGIMAVVGLGLVGLGIAAAIVIPAMLRAAANKNSSNANVERRGESNSNLNSNTLSANSNTDSTNENTNTVADGELETSAPTDETQVLAELKDLEQEWTIANINADKQKLDRILADDYVGVSSQGKNQGKAEYIRTIERDTSIEKWDFEDLKVALEGDRASLTGTVRFQLPDREAAFRFTDKFVWREGRWQAVSSEVSPVK